MGDFFKFLWPSQNIWTLMVCLNQSKFQNAAFCPHIQKWIDFTHWNGIPFKLCSFLVRHSVCFGIICQNPIACPIVIVWHEMEKLQKKKTLDILMFGKKIHHSNVSIDQGAGTLAIHLFDYLTKNPNFEVFSMVSKKLF